MDFSSALKVTCTAVINLWTKGMGIPACRNLWMMHMSLKDWTAPMASMSDSVTIPRL